jgi:hypothetical protein
MRRRLFFVLVLLVSTGLAAGAPPEPTLIVKPDALSTLVNPNCSHCKDEAKRRAGELRATDPILCWTRGYSDGGAIPYRFFLNPYRVISDSYGVFVHDAEAGYARGYAPSYQFRFHGWRNGVMIMKHQDGTLYSCLSGVAFAGPKKGTRLTPIPTLVSQWGFWLENYPHAVAYHMFDKYQPMELPAATNPESVASRGPIDKRLPAETAVLGVWADDSGRAYPIEVVSKAGLLVDEIEGHRCVILWQPATKTAAAYRPVALPPQKYAAPRPNRDGESPPDSTPVKQTKVVTLQLDAKVPAAPFVDRETGSRWDVAGRATAGTLKGYTLTWVDSVQVKWFAWAAEYPQTTVYAPTRATANPDPKQTMKEIAGTAEFLRVLPKPFATLKSVDAKNRTVTLLIEGEKVAKVWSVELDAEIKVAGWWGHLDQFKPGDRVWVWLKLNRQKNPVSVVMMADIPSEQEIHGNAGQRFDQARIEQQGWLRQRWLADGLPGTVTFHHVFSGELEITLDHEAMRWGRSLKPGDVTHLAVDPPVKAVVKEVRPWREHTVVRLVVGELESSELKIGQRLGLKMSPSAEALAGEPYPPDSDRPRPTAERIEWFLASIYCTCGVGNDVCTGHFYTLASCNPNGCGMPNHTRQVLAKLIAQGKTDRQVFDELLKEHGPTLLRPHLKPQQPEKPKAPAASK